MNREKWQPFLKRWSEEWIVSHDPEKDGPLDEAVVRGGWLGFGPARAEEIAAVEARLGRPLPPSLREFLLITNGWRDAGCFIYRLAGARELEWLADTDDDHWIDAYSGLAEEDEPDESEIIGRSLRISLEGDAAVLFLDPDDVDERGEWAGYWLSSWSGEGPERFDSFYDLMYDQYVSFHGLRSPAGETRDRWDAKVEQARLAALNGEIDGPLAVLEEAGRFGRDRATLLHFQLLAMLNDWYHARLHSVAGLDGAVDHLRDPLFAAELLPLLFVEDKLRGYGDCLTLQQLREYGPDGVRELIADFEVRRGEPGFRLAFGNPEFDAEVHRIVDGLTADPAFHVPDPFAGGGFVVGTVAEEYDRAQERKRRLIDAAWPDLRAAIRLWRPKSEDHIAPVALFADPVLAEMISEERGREILSMGRG